MRTIYTRMLVLAGILMIAIFGGQVIMRGIKSWIAPSMIEPPFTLELTKVVDGLERPVHVTHAGDGSARLFVVEQKGRIRIVKSNQVLPQPFLDITKRVGSEHKEQGLLSVAFHPRYAENGQFFVNYTNQQGDTVIERYRVSSDPNQADAASAAPVLAIDQPAPNHNGGQLAFGPDGYLYIGMGDGGGAGDRFNNGQNLQSLLGKLLRIDVDGAQPYAIPPDNPFVGQPAARPEIWAFGLRNPWRFTFDRETGDLFIGDVGQNEFEELNFQPAGSRGGQNYGWPIMEASSCFRVAFFCKRSGLELPIAEHERELGCSIIAGFRYHGQALPVFTNTYVFGDFCSGSIWGLIEGADSAWQKTELLKTKPGISSFGEDEQGELYMVEHVQGLLYQLKVEPHALQEQTGKSKS